MPDSSPDVGAQAPELDTSATGQTSGTQVSDGTTAASSTAETKAGSMLEAVKAAVEVKDATPASEPGDEAEAESNGAAKTEDSDELTPEELKAIGQKTGQRFKSLKTKLDAKDGEIASLKPKADEFDKINQFVTNAGLKNEDVGRALEISALIVNDKPEALKVLRSYVAQLENMVGETLPPELQEQVRLGYLTEAHAKELNKSRAGERTARERADNLTEKQRRDADAKQQGDLVDGSIKAAETWETKKAEKDPDWHLKRKDVADKVELAIAREQTKRGKPYFPNAEEIVKLSEGALKEVAKRFKAPTKPAITPVNGSASNRSAPQPKTMLDVVRNSVSA